MQILSPLETINHPLLTHHNITLKIKRDDRIHPQISGNKWRKLAYSIKHIQQQGYEGILSFGGAYSNHIHALAYAGKLHHFKTMAIIRGETEYANNATLSQASRWGMKLTFVTREQYKNRSQPDYLQRLQQKFPQYFIVPEGGSNQFALSGVEEVINEINQQTKYSTIMTPVGSGGTLAGLISGDNNQHTLLGVAVLKQGQYLTSFIKNLLPADKQHFKNWQLLTEFHGGGYGKFSATDCKKIIEFSQLTGVPFEPIYSGKMLLAFLSLLEQGYFASGSTVVLLHTGGLQGLNGLAERGKINANDWALSSK